MDTDVIIGFERRLEIAIIVETYNWWWIHDDIINLNRKQAKILYHENKYLSNQNEHKKESNNEVNEWMNDEMTIVGIDMSVSEKVKTNFYVGMCYNLHP